MSNSFNLTKTPSISVSLSTVIMEGNLMAGDADGKLIIFGLSNWKLALRHMASDLYVFWVLFSSESLRARNSSDTRSHSLRFFHWCVTFQRQAFQGKWRTASTPHPSSQRMNRRGSQQCFIHTSLDDTIFAERSQSHSDAKLTSPGYEWRQQGAGARLPRLARVAAWKLKLVC